MSLLVAILLGIIQGITEFIPVSSTGHLAIAGEIINLGNHFDYDVLLNIGTLSALLWYTRNQLITISRRAIKGDYAVILKLIVGTLPAVIIGSIFAEVIEGFNDNISLVAYMLIGIGLLMFFIKEKPNPKADIADISWAEAAIIGTVQCLALIPGSSRAGVTILAGMFLGLRRPIAAEWSFLMAIPVVAGATLKVLLSSSGLELLSNNFGAVIVGNMASFLVGLVAISALMKLLKTSSLRSFGVYRIGLGIMLIVLVSTNVL